MTLQALTFHFFFFLDLLIMALTASFFFIVYTDKGAETMFANGEGPVFIESVKWLEDEDSRLQMAAVLAIGNFARNGQYLNYKAIKV